MRSLSPGEPRSPSPLNVSILLCCCRWLYYYAHGTDASGKHWTWNGEGQDGAFWLELQDSNPTGADCTRGSSDCRALTKVLVGWTQCSGNGRKKHVGARWAVLEADIFPLPSCAGGHGADLPDLVHVSAQLQLGWEPLVGFLSRLHLDQVLFAVRSFLWRPPSSHRCPTLSLSLPDLHLTIRV